MDYKDVLEAQKVNLESNIKWWPNFLYHFTDIHNASQILYDGFIYSRQQAQINNVMVNDNASHAVIEATSHDSKCYGRLYFRPLTPTQYHNEGYKPEGVRHSDINACCPVPVFLCLNANATLNLPDTKFAEKGISGNKHNIKQGIVEFQKLNFGKIYHNGSYNPSSESDIKDYRHSEVIHENGFPVEPLLKGIICRTESEREMMLFLLKQFSIRLYNTYKDKVIYNPNLKCFYNNGIFVKNIKINGELVKIEFNDPEQRKKTSGLSVLNIVVDIFVSYRLLNGTVVTTTVGKGTMNYCTVRSCSMKLLDSIKYDTIRIKILINENEMYENEVCVNDEIIF